MGRRIEHELLAPDGTSLAVIASGRIESGETIQRFIGRQGWYFHLPTRCFVNGEVIPPSRLVTHRISRRDEIRIVSRPGRGGGSGAATAKSVGAIVALVALTVLAPWAGGALAAMIGPGATLAGISYSSLFTGVPLGGRSVLLEDLP